MGTVGLTRNPTNVKNFIKVLIRLLFTDLWHNAAKDRNVSFQITSISTLGLFWTSQSFVSNCCFIRHRCNEKGNHKNGPDAHWIYFDEAYSRESSKVAQSLRIFKLGLICLLLLTAQISVSSHHPPPPSWLPVFLSFLPFISPSVLSYCLFVPPSP